MLIGHKNANDDKFHQGRTSLPVLFRVSNLETHKNILPYINKVLYYTWMQMMMEMHSGLSNHNTVLTS